MLIVFIGFLFFVCWSRDVINLKKRTIYVNEGRLRSPVEVPDRDGLAIVQLIKGPGKGILDYVASEMGLLEPAWKQYLDGDAFLVHGNLRTIFEKAEEIDEVTFVDLFYDADKTVLNYPYDMEPDLSRRSLEEIEPTMIEAGTYFELPKDHILEDFPYEDVKYKVTNELIQVYATHHFREITEYLASLPYVYWVHRSERKQVVLNYGARQLVGTGSWENGDEDAEWLWDQGLDGEGQVVGVVDTGLDYWNCMFDDQDYPLTYPDDFNDTINGHRKLVSYYCMGSHEGMDVASGHGTHVAGSVAGYCLTSQGSRDNDYAGVARNAKLYFAGGSPPGSSSLVVDKPYGSNLFARMVPYGTTIATNSWGCSIGSLGLKWSSDDSAYYWDLSEFQEENTTCPTGEGDISDWAGSNAPAKDSDCRKCYGYEDEEYGCANLCNRYTLDEYQLDQWLVENDEFTVLFAAGNDGDKSDGDSLTLSPSTAKNVVSVGSHRTTNENMRQGTAWIDWLQRGYSSECCGSTSEMVCCESAQIEFYTDQEGQYNENCMSTFSSRGPVRKMIQPDVVSPGEFVISAHSRGEQDDVSRFDAWDRPALGNDAALLTSQGTSMSTPVTAGLVALYRQFFTDGYYTGSPSITSPKSYTLKAFLVHGTETLLGKIIIGGEFYDLEHTYPNNKQGFGRPVGKNVLEYEGRTNFVLKVYEGLNMTQDESFSYCFQKLDDDEDADVRATVAWHDIPAHPAVTLSNMLINNIDMIACRQDGFCWPANMNPYRDKTQNILHIRAGPSILETDDYIGFRIEGTEIRSGGQAFTLIISGAGLREQDVSECNIPAWEDAIFPDWNGVVDERIVSGVWIVMLLSFFFL